MYSSRKGLFVVIEGIDGSGKTTIAKKLVEKLKSMGY
ncbi:MAG: dTMP kinase, partial [Ignisphaera sp.]